MTLNFHVEQLLTAAYESTGDKEKKEIISSVKKAIANWSKLNSDCYLANFFYRIGQAFLYVFGQADWQVARNSLANRAIKPLEKLAKQFKITIPSELEKVIYKTSDKVLEILLKFNDRNFLENENPIDPTVLLTDPIFREIAKDVLAIGTEVVQVAATSAVKVMKETEIKIPVIGKLTPAKVGLLFQQAMSSGQIDVKEIVDEAMMTLDGLDIDLKGMITDPQIKGAIGDQINNTVDAIAPALSTLGIDAKLVSKIALKHLSTKYSIAF